MWKIGGSPLSVSSVECNWFTGQFDVRFCCCPPPIAPKRKHWASILLLLYLVNWRHLPHEWIQLHEKQQTSISPSFFLLLFFVEFDSMITSISTLLLGAAEEKEKTIFSIGNSCVVVVAAAKVHRKVWLSDSLTRNGASCQTHTRRMLREHPFLRKLLIDLTKKNVPNHRHRRHRRHHHSTETEFKVSFIANSSVNKETFRNEINTKSKRTWEGLWRQGEMSGGQMW